MKRWLLCLPILAGCAADPVIRTVEVEIPVGGECEAPPPIVRPDLPIYDVVPGVTPDKQVIKAYAATVEALFGYTVELEELLDGYREKTGD